MEEWWRRYFYRPWIEVQTAQKRARDGAQSAIANVDSQTRCLKFTVGVTADAALGPGGAIDAGMSYDRRIDRFGWFVDADPAAGSEGAHFMGTIGVQRPSSAISGSPSRGPLAPRGRIAGGGGLAASVSGGPDSIEFGLGVGGGGVATVDQGNALEGVFGENDADVHPDCPQ